METRSRSFRYTLGATLLLAAAFAHAHSETGVADGLVSGLLHPVVGLDHLIAMVAVGIWGAQLGSPAVWTLPVAFPMLMAGGALLGLAGFPLPAVEFGVSLSAALLGLLILFAIRLPLALAITVVALFGAWHGYAHGMELPSAVSPLAYGVGFVTATGLLHLAGILLGLLLRWPKGVFALRGVGGVIACAGGYFLTLNVLP